MKRTVTWSHEAVEDLFDLTVRDQKLARRIMITVRGFGMGQRTDLKKLSGQRTWRLRAGDWRVILLLDGDEATVESIDNRRDAY